MKNNKLDIKLLAMDVDGVMTDGGLIMHADHTESKKFNVKDGAWIRIWKRQGFLTAIITGKQSKAVEHRAEDLQIDFLHQKVYFKAEALDKILSQSNLLPHQIAYIGDDVIDLPVIHRVGFSAAVADAVPEVRQAVDYVTRAKGGQGAVQEVISFLFKEMGIWDQAMKRYLTPEAIAGPIEMEKNQTTRESDG